MQDLQDLLATNHIYTFAIVAIPVTIGIVKGITHKLGWEENKYRKELVTILVSLMAVVYDHIFLDELSAVRAITLFIIIYFGASGIYHFLKPNNKDDMENEDNG